MRLRFVQAAAGKVRGVVLVRVMLAFAVVLVVFGHAPALVAQSPAAPPDVSAPSLRSVAVGLREMSPWSMFMSATIVVQAIMVGLAFASLVTWTIFVAKTIELSLARSRLSKALRIFSSARTLDEALSALPGQSIVRGFVAAAINEVRMSSDLEGIKERVGSLFAEIISAEARRIRIGMSLLATIGATAPFVGLFGTVWGIMNSFIGISKLQTTNLAVVAPGIAEALLATAMGLFAAIPAVIIYNHFGRVTKGYLELVRRAAGATSRQLSRDFERASAEPMRRAAE